MFFFSLGTGLSLSSSGNVQCDQCDSIPEDLPLRLKLRCENKDPSHLWALF
jgi:hypothetical protein